MSSGPDDTLPEASEQLQKMLTTLLEIERWVKEKNYDASVEVLLSALERALNPVLDRLTESNFGHMSSANGRSIDVGKVVKRVVSLILCRLLYIATSDRTSYEVYLVLDMVVKFGHELIFDPLEYLPKLLQDRDNFDKIARALYHTAQSYTNSKKVELPLVICSNRPDVGLFGRLYQVLSCEWRPEDAIESTILGIYVGELRDWLTAWTPEASGSFPRLVQDKADSLSATDCREISEQLAEWIGSLIC